MATPEVNIHVHIHFDGEESVLIPQIPRIKRKLKPRTERIVSIKDLTGKTWLRRDIQRTFTDGFPIWLQLEGVRASERVDMNVEFEGDEMEFVGQIGKRARRGFESGYGRNLDAERMTRILKEQAKVIGGTDHLDHAMQYTADFLGFMTRISDSRREELRAIILNEELPLAS